MEGLGAQLGNLVNQCYVMIVYAGTVILTLTLTLDHILVPATASIH